MLHPSHFDDKLNTSNFIAEINIVHSIMQKTKCGDFRKRIAARWENETLQKNITNYKFIG